MELADVPAGLLASLAASSAPRALLIRHSDRPPLADGDSGHTTALTEIGVARARRLGERLGGAPTWALSSPLLRCTQTARELGVIGEPSRHLGDPGPFVVDQVAGRAIFTRNGTREIVYAQMRGETWGCMRPLELGCRLVHDLLMDMLRASGGTGLAVSHDAIVMPFIAWATGESFADAWLDPLDGIVVTPAGFVWRGQRFEARP